VALPVLSALLLLLAVAQFTTAQIHGIPPSVTSIQNHFPPYLPNVPASVTSLGPHGYVGPPAFPVYPRYQYAYSGRRGYGDGYHGRGNYGYSDGYHGRGNYGYGDGYHGRGNYGYVGGYVVPYYAPIFDAGYGYDGDGGAPYMYSGPPPEQTLHIVVDSPPVQRMADDGEDVPPPAAKSHKDRDGEGVPYAKPNDPTVLVFRDGHKQEVSNYAIMGQTVYVFDNRTKKFALGDIDVPATIKLNDDRGVEFRIPAKKS
jgi:hypothetical protein